MGDRTRVMEKGFKGNAETLLTISFDVHPSSHCCHFPALTWQWRFSLIGSCCQEEETGILGFCDLVFNFLAFLLRVWTQPLSKCLQITILFIQKKVVKTAEDALRRVPFLQHLMLENFIIFRMQQKQEILSRGAPESVVALMLWLNLKVAGIALFAVVSRTVKSNDFKDRFCNA